MFLRFVFFFVPRCVCNRGNKRWIVEAVDCCGRRCGFKGELSCVCGVVCVFLAVCGRVLCVLCFVRHTVHCRRKAKFWAP